MLTVLSRIPCSMSRESTTVEQSAHPWQGGAMTAEKPEIDFPDGPPPSDLEVTELTRG